MLLTLFAFALALGLLVTFHELGHYWVARWCGVRILRFSVGFGPILARRIDRRGTEWALSAIPLGGYVKMLDDAPEQADAVTRAAAFNGKPLAQRAAVVLAGPAANLILAAVLYALLSLWGTHEPVAVLAQPPAASAAAQAGVQAGDTVLAVDGRAVASWNQARWQLLEPLTSGGAVTLTLRAAHGAERSLRLDLPAQALSPDGPDPLRAAGLVLLAPQPQVGAVSPGGAAQQAGLLPGDRILAVGAQAQPSVQGFVQAVQAHAGQPLALTIERGAAQIHLRVIPAAVSAEDGVTQGRIGALIEAYQPQTLVRLGLLDSLWTGVRRTWDTSAFTLRMMGRMAVGAVSWRNVSGPVTIAEVAGQTARVGLEAYLGFLALISISIGILNLLPIPMLDGGHLLFYLLEALRGGRPVPERVRDAGLRIGMSLVLGLMFLALFNDFSRLFR